MMQYVEVGDGNLSETLGLFARMSVDGGGPTPPPFLHLDQSPITIRGIDRGGLSPHLCLLSVL